MKCLVLGGSGFIGSHIVDELYNQGVDVLSFGRRPGGYDSPVKHITGNFLNTDELDNSLTEVNVVVHSISTTVPASAAEQPIYDIETNLLGTIKLVQRMFVKGVSKLVYLSSGGTVYGNPNCTPVTEEALLAPLSTYGATKVAIECHLQVLCRQFDIDLVIIRPSNPFGPRQGGAGIQGLIATLINKALTGKTVTIYGDGLNIRDYIYVGDVAKAISLSITKSITGIFNIGYGTGYTINQIIEFVEQETGIVIKKRFAKERSFDVREIVLDSSKAESELSWNCHIDISKGIKLQLNWLKEQDLGCPDR